MIGKKIHRLVEKMKADNSSGASEFIEKTLDVITTQLKLVKDIKQDITPSILELFRILINCRPSMAPLINTIGYFIPEDNIITKEYLLRKLESFQEDRIKREKQLEASFQSFMRNFVKENVNLMIISYSSTINKLLTQNHHFNMTFYVLESRPLLEGRKTAEILSSKYDTHLIVDAAIGKFMKKIDLVLIGIDSILADGSIINKIGTYPLACLAQDNKKKVYVVGDSFKYNLKSHYGQDIGIEEKPAGEIYDKRIKNESLKILNYYFDKTPSKYIDGIISDLGILQITEFIKKIKTILPIKWFETFLETSRLN